jgi:RNA polymerase sigma-70 factor, ECF subfamily
LETSDATLWFYETLWPHRAVVLRAALIQTGNAAEADDLAQETFLKAFKAVDTFQKQTSAKAWLLTILRNTRIDRLRTAAGAARHMSLEDLPAEPPAPASHEAAHAEAAWQNPEELLNAFSDEHVIEALQKIAEELRWTLLLVDVEGMDHSEAAKILGVPVGTIKSRVHRGRALLRQALASFAREHRLVRD